MARPPRQWTPDEDAALRTQPVRQVAERLGIAEATCRKRMRDMGITPVSSRRWVWTRERDEIVRAYNVKEAQALLGCCRDLIANRRKSLGVKGRTWHPALIEKLRSLWGKVSRARLRAEVGKTQSAVDRMARKLGLQRGRRDWHRDEDRWLVANIAEVGERGAARRLRRSERAIQLRLWELGVSKDQRTNDLSTALVCSMLGVDQSTVAQWIRMKLLKARRRGDRGVLWVTPRDLRRFVVENPERVNPKCIGVAWPTLVKLIGKEWG